MTSALQTYYAPKSIDDAVRIASALSTSKMFPDIKSPEMAFAKMIAGAELGFGPFASISGVDLIKGKPAISAKLIASAVKASTKYDFRIVEHTNDVCKIEFFQYESDKKESIGISQFSMDDARQAKITGKDNWKNYPRNMLFARAISNGVRWHCPDVFHGSSVYTHEELGAEEPVEADVIEITDIEKDTSAAVDIAKEVLDGEVIEETGHDRYYKWLGVMKDERQRIGTPMYKSILHTYGLAKANEIDKMDFKKMKEIFEETKDTPSYRTNTGAWYRTLDCIEGRLMKQAESKEVTPIGALLQDLITSEQPIEETDQLKKIENEDVRENIVDTLSSEYYD
tara:strand:- start:5436 stop:6455 length:1020 start_codon:yes stop_codon:yes gene_type:complete